MTLSSSDTHTADEERNGEDMKETAPGERKDSSWCLIF